MRVMDVMHAGAATVDAETLLGEVARQMRDADVGAVPVLSQGRLVGMITDRDITCRAVAGSADPRRMKAGEAMSRKAIVCSPEDDLDAAMEMMSQQQIRRLPVVDAEHQLVGMLSLGDISHRVDEEDAGEVLRAVSAHHV